ncbi:MAG TPA: hypothetical protein PLX02_07265 [Syntrophorhabdaceae bacterium]|nr:hypothetical protein [Syntrophorhabdaceae bacterium]HQM81405.1 hypothetical protein [Syntrophorhabdaceae bacterium]
MLTRVGERVAAGVVFRKEGRKMELKWFLWKGRRLEIKKTTYMWRERDGRELIHRFVVTDGKDLYELSYRQEGLMWFLEAVETDG